MIQALSEPFVMFDSVNEHVIMEILDEVEESPVQLLRQEWNWSFLHHNWSYGECVGMCVEIIDEERQKKKNSEANNREEKRNAVDGK